MFCMKCGTQLPDDANFCIKCGYSFNNSSQSAPAMNVPLTETKIVPARCTNCNASLQVDANKEAAVCPYCNSAFIVSKAINNIRVENAVFSLNGATVNVNNQINTGNYIKRAKEYIRSRNYSNAEGYLDKVLDQEPENKEAQELMYIVLLKEVISTEIHNYAEVIRALSKATAFDNDPYHMFVTDYLCYLGSCLEEKMFSTSQPVQLFDYNIILPYYEKAYELHPENEFIRHAARRVHYILNDYCFGACESHGARYEIKANEFVIWKGTFKRTAQRYSYREITNVQQGAFDNELVSFSCRGVAHTVRIGFTDVKRFYNALNNAISGYYLLPSYKTLFAMKLANKNESKQFELVSYYDKNGLFREIQRIDNLNLSAKDNIGEQVLKKKTDSWLCKCGIRNDNCVETCACGRKKPYYKCLYCGYEGPQKENLCPKCRQPGNWKEM